MEKSMLYGMLALLAVLLIVALILLGIQRRRFARDLEAQRDELLDAMDAQQANQQMALRALSDSLIQSVQVMGQG